MNNMLDWAKHEVELAIAREKEEDTEDEGFGYAKACYESALKAFSSLCKDGHSGMSISFTKGILNRLLLHKPLTPIEDNPDEWVESWKSDDGIAHYQNVRLSSLFKDVYPDGTVEYCDLNAFECMDEDSKIPYHGGGAYEVFKNYFDITFPYTPPVKKYCLTTREYLTDRKNGDFDTKLYNKIIYPDGTEHYICRYFKESENGWQEIEFEEFLKRIDMHIKREEQEENQNESI